MYKNVKEIKEANIKAGYSFFNDENMRFFKCRLLSKVYGGKYFITSEVFMGEPRKYTVRVILEDKLIETMGLFNKLTVNEAKTLAKMLGDTE
jgi:hypothetical protein